MRQSPDAVGHRPPWCDSMVDSGDTSPRSEEMFRDRGRRRHKFRPVAISRRDLCPVRLELPADGCDDVRMVGDQVVRLSRVRLDVIEFRVVNQPPARGHAHRATPLFRLEGPLALDEQSAVGSLCLRVAQLREKLRPSKSTSRGSLSPQSSTSVGSSQCAR